MKLVAKKNGSKAAHKPKRTLVAKAKAKAKPKMRLVSKSKKTKKSAAVKKSRLTGKRVKKTARGGPRERSGRFSLFRPKVRGRAYPVQDNTAGWKLFDRLIKQLKLSGSDIFTLGMRLLAREYPEMDKESAMALAKRLNEHEFKLAS